MRQSSLRWALILGGIAAALGLFAAIAGNLVAPNTGTVDINRAVAVLLVAGLLGLLALGIALGLAYFAGLRVEQARPRTSTPVDPDLDPSGERRDSALAGLIVMGLYWFCTTLYTVFQAAHSAGAGSGSTSTSGLLIQRVVIGVVFLLLGFGLGALGGRAPAARRLLDDIATAPPAPVTPSAPAAAAPAASSAASPQSAPDASVNASTSAPGDTPVGPSPVS